MPHHPLLDAIDACATLTQIQLDKRGIVEFSPVKLQGVMTRNQELGRFVTNPGIYPTNKLLALMCQFDNCPSGRYMLARHLPAVFSFERIKRTASSTDRKQKKVRYRK
jgi:hypothetical protein